MNRAKRKYMKLLKDYFPYGRACRKKFLVSVADDIENFVREHERCTYEMLVEEFGKPQEVILNYRKEIEISDIRNVRKLAAKYVIATACSCFSCLACMHLLAWVQNQKTQKLQQRM